MKGKFRILGHLGLALFVACALMLAAAPAAKVEASSSVSSVWMEFPTAAHNDIDTAAQMDIHFTTGIALNLADTITVMFPDGIDTTMGPAGSAYDFDFTSGPAVGTAAYYKVKIGTSFVTCVSNATVAGYRVKVTTPVAIPASTAVTLRIEVGAAIKTPHSAATSAYPYKVKVATSKDTAFALSSAFPVDDSKVTNVANAGTNPSSSVAGGVSAYAFSFTSANLVSTAGTITVQFPAGTFIPDAEDITLSNVKAGDTWAGVLDDAPVSYISTDPVARTITVKPGEQLGADDNNYVYFNAAVGIKNPEVIGGTGNDAKRDIFIWTSTDGQKATKADFITLTADNPAKLSFTSTTNSSDISDDACIIRAFSAQLYLEVQDKFGNFVAPLSDPTVKLETTGSGRLSAGHGDLTSFLDSVDTSSGKKTLYYRNTVAEVDTITASVEAGGYDPCTWEVTVAPAVVIKDASDNTVGTYGPSTTESTQTLGGTYIASAITAAMTGDTIELGTGIYELDTVLTLDEKITLAAASEASPILRPTAEMEKAINVTADGRATSPVIIDGLTFTRLRAAQEFDCAIYNNGFDYMTVRNCTFDYIIPDRNTQSEAVIYVRTASDAIASCTISDNIFTNCGPYDLDITGRAGVIVCLTTTSGTTKTFTGLTISGNEMTNCYEHGIALKGWSDLHMTASITNNIFTSCKSCINVGTTQGATPYPGRVTITGNTFTDAYDYAIKIESDNNQVKIKNNTITGCLGTYAVTVEDSKENTHVVQFNDIYDNASYAIKGQTDTHDCEYNWYGNASGPTVSTNAGGTGDSVTTYVDYSPWLYKSKADVVTDDANYCAQRVSLGVGIHTLSTPALLIDSADTIPELIPDYATLYDGKPKMEYCYKFENGQWSSLGTGTLTPCHGYYIKMNVADSVLLQYDATEMYTPSWLLQGVLEGGEPGVWNLIGLANLSSKRVDYAVASVLKDSAGLPGYSQVISPSMNTSSWSYSAGQVLATDATTPAMAVGEGYWIYMQNDATLAGFTIFPLVPDLD